jgi:hypothetical protein
LHCLSRLIITIIADGRGKTSSDKKFISLGDQPNCATDEGHVQGEAQAYLGGDA